MMQSPYLASAVKAPSRSPCTSRHVMSSCLWLCLWSCIVLDGTAHELPERVTVRMIIAPTVQADRTAAMEIMVRVPLEAMRDVDFPLEGPGYLVIDQAEAALSDAAGLWVADEITLRSADAPLAKQQVQTRLALPANRAFDSLADARAHFAAPALAPSSRIFWRQALLDIRIVLPLPPGTSADDLVLDAALQHLGVITEVQLLYIATDGKQAAFTFDGHISGLALQPGIGRIAGDFLVRGVLHILGGIDHLLFLVCLAVPLRRMWPLVRTVTAFTVAHSLTLAAAALGQVPNALWFPALVETLIAASIVFLAIENVLLGRFGHRPWIAFAFGLVHGCGFSFALAESMQFAQGVAGAQLLALATFNLGVEAGQLAVLALLVPGLALLMRRLPDERLPIFVISLIIGHTGWHWMSERAEILLGYLQAIQA